MKEKNCAGVKAMVFGAGKAFDDFGRATPFWTGVVVYRWDAEKQAFVACTVQMLGTGTNINSYATETVVCEEVNDFLDPLKVLERYYKKVYGE